MSVDPFTAIGLAASVLQFLSFAKTCVSEGRELYRSSAGITSENQRTAVSATALLDLVARLEQGISRVGPSPSRSQRGICDVAKDCRDAATELLRGIDETRLSSHRNVLRSVKGVILGYLHKSAIETWRKRLDAMQRELSTHLLVQLRYVH